jgi:ABC-type branched-subunit amino acid transport system substrate-binding protein
MRDLVRRTKTGRTARSFSLPVVVVGLAALVIAGIASARPAAPNRSTACTLGENGTISFYMSQDTKAAIGDEIGPAGVRAANAWIEYTNKNGGVVGCKIAMGPVDDEAFGNDITTCLRNYRSAIASKKYAFLLGPTNSACMFQLGDVAAAAGMPLISGIAADHQPFMEKYKSTNFHASVSTFLEGRGSAVAAKKLGWKKAALFVPNYAYGQDSAKAFKQQFEKDGGTITTQQEAPFDESDFAKYINPIAAGNPDGLFTAYFGPLIPPFWKYWKGSGQLGKIDLISGLTVLATYEVVKTPADLPAGVYGYNRAPWQLLGKTKIGAGLAKLYLAKYGKKSPLVSEFAYQIFSSLQMAKSLIEKSNSLKGSDWQKVVEKGDFSFSSPYHSGPTYVNPINHMADTCVTVGKQIWNAKGPARYRATMDPKTFVTTCMHDILPAAEAKTLTKNPGVSAAAITKYYSLAKANN